MRRALDFLQDLAVLLTHGTPLAEAAWIVASDGSPHAVRVAQEVSSGRSLGGALAAVGFPAWACAAVEATQEAGTLPRGLQLVAQAMADERAWHERVRRALAYPCLVVASALVVGLVVSRSVLPSVVSLTHELGGMVPWSSRAAIGLGRAASWPGIWLLLAATAVLGGWVLSARARWLSLVVRVPGARSLVQWAEASRFFGIATVLLETGVPVHRALAMAGSVVDYRPWRSQALDWATRVEGGESTASSCAAAAWLPARTQRTLAVAEAAERMPQGFAALRDYAHGALLNRFNLMVQWIPVVVLSVAAVFVGFLAHALLSPALFVEP